MFSNVYDVLVRVDKSGTKLGPGLASWEVSPDGTVYTFKMRDAKFEDGSPLTAKDAAFSLTRIRDKDSLWADTYKVIKSAEAKDDKTLVVTLNQPVVPFLATLAMPGASILSEKAVTTSLGEAAYASKPLASGAFGLADWKRGDTVTLKKNPNFWQADRVKLDGVKWISVVDDNARMLKLQAGEVDCAIFVPFSKVAELKQDPNLTILIRPSTREDHLLINHERGRSAKRGPRGGRSRHRQEVYRRHCDLRYCQGRKFLHSRGCPLSQ